MTLYVSNRENITGNKIKSDGNKNLELNNEAIKGLE